MTPDRRERCAACGSDCTDDWRYGDGCERICPECYADAEVDEMEFDAYANEHVDGARP